ncbi:MAG: response regulator transcription factor [Flavobacteriaceae bacterium]|nr:response regulator transcription factor [Flavobacteriaceae bacterium]MDG2414862.1 response regulator transcription factor [Flavobacteriaceae bacterium]
MPNDLEILLVEDNLVVVDNVVRMLSKLGYDKVESVTDYNAAVKILSLKKTHLVLIDILLSGKETGIELGGYIRENRNIPFIFITSNSDRHTVAEAKKVTPNGYLVKPFEKEDLFTAIEIALFNFREQLPTSKEGNVLDSDTDTTALLSDSIFIKKQHIYHRISFSEILYIKADNVYLEVYTTDKTFVVRSSLKEYYTKLPSKFFYKAHKSYIVNIEHINSINAKDIVIGQKKIPITKDFKDFLIKTMNS